MEFNGQPVDEIDKACLSVYNSYKCMLMDYENGELNQIGRHKCYKGQTFNWYFDTTNTPDGEIKCGTPTNPNYIKTAHVDGCRLAACKIEKEFSEKVYEILNAAGGPEAWQAKNVGNYGKCDVKVSNIGGSAGERDSCCGAYPSRFPYNSVVKQCCDGGVVGFGDGC